jgi:F0F1-type ATP synthase membrane subunit b/b'
VKYRINYIVFISLIFTNAIANEAAAEHEATIWDLKYPVLNAVIFFGFMIWKLKKPLSDMFTKKSEDIKSLMNSAEKQSKDAAEKLNTYEQKIKNLSSELVKISTEYDSDVTNFAKNQSEETQTTITRMKRDVANKLEGEMKELSEGLSSDLLDLVVAKAQNSIGTNADLKKKATNNLVLGIK